MAPIGILGVPTNSAGTLDGVARGPAALRDAGLVEALGRYTDARDYGDVLLPKPSPYRDASTQLIDPKGLVALATGVREAVASILGDGRFPIVIGGDCPVLLGCLAAGEGDRIGLLFIDGHEDAYLPEQSRTGEAADMELAFALGMVDVSWSMELTAMLPLISPADVRVLGPRDASELEAEHVASLRDLVPFVDGESLSANPVGETELALASLVEPWWFHLDLDVLSTGALPAVDYRQEGGLGWDALASVAVTAVRSRPAGWDVTIYNPDLDPGRTHARRIVAFIAAVARAIPGPPP